MAEQIAIEVQIDTKTVATSIGVLTQRLEILKAEQKRINDEFKTGQITAQEYGEQISDVKQQMEQATRELKSNTAAMQIATTEGLKENATLDEQRQYLNTLQKAYANLTTEQKLNAEGTDVLAGQIKSLSDSVKAQEMAIGDARRNVGNYGEAITGAFGQMARAGELLSPSIGILRKMGPEGQKAADGLDALQKILQLTGKAGQVFAAATQVQTVATQAQTVATNGATVAQSGLNAAMAANPIGLVTAAISALLPIMQAFITKHQEAAQAAEEQKEKELELKAALSDAKDEYEKYVRNKKVAKLNQQAKASYDALTDSIEENTLKIKSLQAEMDLTSDKTKWEELNQQGKELLDTNSELARKQAEILNNPKNYAKEVKNATNSVISDLEKTQRELEKIQADAASWLEKQMEETAKKRREERDEQFKRLIKERDKLFDAVDESEDEDDIPTPDEMARKLFGLDDEGVKRFRELLNKGLSFQEAAMQAQEEMFERMDETRRKHDDGIIKTIEKWANAVMGAVGSIAGAMNAAEDAELAKYKQANDAKKKMLDERLKKGLISQAQYDKEVAAMEAAEARKSDEIALKQAKREKAIGIVNATINTALAVARAYADYPWMIALPISLLAAAAGAAQIATIAKTPLPEPQAYATGGIVPGTSYTGDAVTARVNSGEMILNRDQQTRLFDALSGTANNNSLGFNYEMMAAAMAAQPAPVVVYTELQEFGQKVTTYNEIASV